MKKLFMFYFILALLHGERVLASHYYLCTYVSKDGCDGYSLGTSLSLKFLNARQVQIVNGWPKAGRTYTIGKKADAEPSKNQVRIQNMDHQVSNGGKMDMQFDRAMTKAAPEGSASLFLISGHSFCTTRFHCLLK